MVAVVGEVGFEDVIAVGAYYLDPASNLAEVAYSVSKPWQGKGLSSVIQGKLAQAARDNGISGLLAYTDPSNRAMISLFNKLPYETETRWEEGILVLTCRFDKPKKAPASGSGA
jgi:RimJ/RimL family protein N-acetyltransferase